ncbi:MAG: hypothetical protein MR927_00675 [Campylobacter sp.]|uniref:hypothetical protein n=1 Tax=Campylobacter sp. TaxID=205 RepID=UPI002A5469C0|nr:hypothetical protein [Campylobacter sp.]MCI7102698.1 hypothetical protein [Campylobacter sp.]MDD7091110.1 hypothetical protein [Campylobacteraceae bacterium]MDY5285759.1 hypothetical protein [Campylobacter sp.]
MNENEMLNDKPIFVAKRRIFRSLILAAIALKIALLFYSVAQEPEVDKPGQVVGWFCVGFCGIGGVVCLYRTLIFKKIMLFDDRIEAHFLNKVIVRTYSQIKSCCFTEGRWPMKDLSLECEPKFIHISYLSNIFLHKNDLHKIEEILIKKGVKDRNFD